MDDAPAPDMDALDEVRGSARGWHTIQIAALGLIGLCGVLQSSGHQDGPQWVHVLAAILVLGSLVLACLAIAMVATVAWPVAARNGAGPGDAIEQAVRRLRRGIVVTFVAVAMLALAATSSWWPTPEPGATSQGLVRVSTRAGSACGELTDGGPGQLGLTVGGRGVVVTLSDVVSVVPVDSC